MGLRGCDAIEAEALSGDAIESEAGALEALEWGDIETEVPRCETSKG